MESNTNKGTTTCGVSFVGILTVAFIVLKLVGVITWSWIWVLSPIWISWIICLVIIAICAIVSYKLKL